MPLEHETPTCPQHGTSAGTTVVVPEPKFKRGTIDPEAGGYHKVGPPPQGCSGSHGDWHTLASCRTPGLQKDSGISSRVIHPNSELASTSMRIQVFSPIEEEAVQAIAAYQDALEDLQLAVADGAEDWIIRRLQADADEARFDRDVLCKAADCEVGPYSASRHSLNTLLTSYSPL